MDGYTAERAIMPDRSERTAKGMKIAILGYSGSGKSTLAQKLGDRYGAPVLFLDTAHFLPGWAERDDGEARAIVDRFMQNDFWVIDGNYGNLRQAERLAQADAILILLLPRAVCFFRAWKRFFRNRNKTRASMAEGCREKIDLEFMRWILWEGRSAPRRRRYRQIAAAYPGKTAVMKSRRAVDEYLRRLPEPAGAADRP